MEVTGGDGDGSSSNDASDEYSFIPFILVVVVVVSSELWW